MNFNFAYAPTDWCGFLFVAGFGGGEVFQSKVKGNVRLGVLYSIDFDKVDIIEFPIGVLAGVRYNTFSEGGSHAE